MSIIALAIVLFLMWLTGWLLFGNGLIHGILVIAVIILVFDHLNKGKNS